MVTVTAPLSRSGSESCYGELLLTLIDPQGKETALSNVKGVGVYVPCR